MDVLQKCIYAFSHLNYRNFIFGRKRIITNKISEDNHNNYIDLKRDGEKPSKF